MNEQQKTLEQEIRSDAERRAERIKKRAQRRADQLTADAREEAQQEREKIMQGARRRVEHEEQIHGARAQQELADLRRRAFERILQRVRAEAQQELASLSEADGYDEVLVRLAVLAIEAMNGRQFALLLREEDRRRLGDELARRIGEAARKELDREVDVRIADRSCEGDGGLVVRGGDGHQVADQTLRARLERLWEQIRVEVAQMLQQYRGDR